MSAPSWRPAASPPATWAGWMPTAICSCWAARRNCWSPPGGLKVHPEVIEQELNNCPDVAHSVIFLKPDATHLTCVVDLAPPGGEEARARVTQIRQQPAGRQESGPVRGSDLRRRAFHQGEWHAAAQSEDRPQGDRARAICNPNRPPGGESRRGGPCGCAWWQSQTSTIAAQAQPGRDGEHVHRGQQIGLAHHVAA